MSEMQTPLIDLLRGVPINATATEHYRYESHHIPYGRHCHEAADEIDRLRAELATAQTDRFDELQDLRAENARLSDELHSLTGGAWTAWQQERDTLRELVREAVKYGDVGNSISYTWKKRAEKVLEKS